ncbi:MAG: hypothetical protein A2V66_09385 [Ignavibacteria bacterium RBG_13_36_8]|nr:MAG: hypothetical protein A2V66_09385 [Ignavibacteria bacterium RBG_13_36_8]
MNNNIKKGRTNLATSINLVRKELSNSILLGRTKNNKEIRLTTLKESPNTLNEIARLREITFREVGEGTGSTLDLDKFDEYYKHLILWDQETFEIIGSYRIGDGSTILNKFGYNGFYTSTLFNFSQELIEDYFPHSIELGRSFIQPKFWNTDALDLLWHGIGAYTANHPNIGFLFGAVSISSHYSEMARRAIVYYFNKWFGSQLNLATSKNKYIIPENTIEEFSICFRGDGHKKDYFTLKKLLKSQGYTVPILFKQYTELCDEGGVQFLDFGIDELFENCVDGLILVDISKAKPEKKERYYKSYSSNNSEQ